VGLAKYIIASHPRRPMGLVGLLTSIVATEALTTVLERSPKGGDARCVDGARSRRSATPTDGKGGQVSSRGPWLIPGEGYSDEERLVVMDDAGSSQSSRPWVAKPSVADTPSDDSGPDHAHAIERPNDRTSGVLL
jgi:hypothetical protein